MSVVSKHGLVHVHVPVRYGTATLLNSSYATLHASAPRSKSVHAARTTAFPSAGPGCLPQADVAIWFVNLEIAGDMINQRRNYVCPGTEPNSPGTDLTWHTWLERDASMARPYGFSTDA